MPSLLVPKRIVTVAILYSAIITIAFLYPSRDLPHAGVPHLDKVVHFVFNAGLVFLWLYYVFLRKRNHLKTVSAPFIILSCFFYGILIEVSQEMFTQSRQADIMDVLANSAGLFIGTLAFNYIKRKI